MTEPLILDGKATAKAVRDEVAAASARLASAGSRPGLAVVLVGDDPASHVYVRNKDKAAHEAGFTVRTERLPADTAQADLEALVERLNRAPDVHGILVQLPLPKGLDAGRVLALLDPAKDVDGLTDASAGALLTGGVGLVPCTPAGCIELMDRYGLPLAGKEVVVIGRSQLVGKPVGLLALARNATVTLCHSRTVDLAGHCLRADVVVAAVGVPNLVQGAWIKPGATVLDVGINRQADGKLVGDVDFASASARAGAITPVPGGVGPMTIAMLMKNTLIAAARAAGVDERGLFG